MIDIRQKTNHIFNVKKEWMQVIIITMIASIPLFSSGIHKGHDIMFHLMRIEGIANEIMNGNIPSYLQSMWNGGYGYPVSVYYGDWLLYLPALLRLCGVSIGVSFKIYVFFINFLTAVISMFSFGKVFKRNDVAFLLTLVFSLSPYRLMNIYVRAAVGEYSAMMFFPLVIVSLYGIYETDVPVWEKMRKYGLLLAISMSCILTTHVLSFEMMCIFILLLVFSWDKRIKMSRLFIFFMSGVVCVFLSAYFLVPFIDYYINVPVYVNNFALLIQAHGISVNEYFAFFKSPFGFSPNMQYTPGILLMCALFYGLYLWYNNKAGRRIKQFVIVSLILLFIASNFFPWNYLVLNFRFFSFFSAVQFPWRYLAFIVLSLIVLLGEILSDNLDSIKRLSWIIYSVSFLCVSVFVSQYVEESEPFTLFNLSDEDTYAVMSGEYVRSENTNDPIVVRLWDHSNKGVAHTDMSKFDGKIHGDFEQISDVEKKGSFISFKVKTKDSATVEVPLSNYKGYEATDNKGNRFEIKDSDNFLVSFDLPADYEGVVTVRYVVPWYWTFALFVSLFSIFVVCFVFVSRRHLAWNQRR